MFDEIPADRDPDLWKSCLDWEMRTHQFHLKLIDQMEPSDAIIICLIGTSAPMRKIIAYALDKLELRCCIQDRGTGGVQFLDRIENPVYRFVHDQQLPGKREFLHNTLTDFGKHILTPEIRDLQEGIEQEIGEICENKGYSWSYQALKVIYYSRMIAYDIEQYFRTHELKYDPQTVVCSAFGEGFEQCAMTWKALLPSYLGLQHPIENDYHFSVSGAPFLQTAVFSERIHIDRDIRLFLWTNTFVKHSIHGKQSKKTDISIGLFSRAAAKLGDPQRCIRLDTERFTKTGVSLEIRDVNDTLYWYSEMRETIFEISENEITVPVYAATRIGGTPPDDVYYIIGEHINYDTFRDFLMRAAANVNPTHRNPICMIRR